MRRNYRSFFALLAIGVLLCVTTSSVYGLSSPNFIIDEDFIGGGGVNDSASPGYRAQDSIGAPAVGSGKSANSQTQSGATTTSDPMLEFSVNTSNVALGSLLTSLTRTGTASFSVRNYTSYGYVVQVLGSPPSTGSHSLAPLVSGGSSVQGVEQFGINVVANTNPAVFGANPTQVPSADFSSGVAASGYATANTYRYNSGDVIARANESSGQTDFTISYIANIANTTPGGSYMGTQTLICTGTY